MLILSLALSLVLLVMANWSVRRPDRWPVGFTICGLLFCIGPLFIGFFLPPVALLSVLLSALLSRSDVRHRLRLCLPLSCLAVAAAFGVTGCFVWLDQQEYARLRERFRFESMESRVPAPRHSLSHEPLPAGAVQRLDWLEASIGEARNSYRLYQLNQLHEEKVKLFINSPGFGIARILRPSEGGLTSGLRPQTHIPQPEAQTGSAGSPGDSQWAPKSWSSELFELHQNSILDFTDANDFGLMLDRQHVAGFQAHQFSQLPGPARHWEVRILDLVGLLLHDEPVAYVSTDLPRMDELREAPTRPLDRFEAAGLDRLRHDKDLVLGAAPGRMRMLGAIRSTKQCVGCHGGKRGDLLGAFSYQLRSTGQ
jgi:hypothetical protein